MYFNIQDRDRGAARIHLSETIEELKKFNARRKLKALVRMAVTSSKWHIYSDPHADNFYDIGDDDITNTGKQKIYRCENKYLIRRLFYHSR